MNNLPVKPQTPLPRAEAETLLERGGKLEKRRATWYIDGQRIHANAARALLADHMRSGRLKRGDDGTWTLGPAPASNKRYCEQIIDHINNNNIPEAIQMLRKLDAELVRLSESKNESRC